MTLIQQEQREQNPCAAEETACRKPQQWGGEGSLSICPSRPTLSLPSHGQVGETTAPAHAHVQL